MTGVFIAADVRDKKMWSVFPSMLRKSITSAGLDSCTRNKKAEIDILHLNQVSYPKVKQAVIIFREKTPLPQNFPENGKTVAVVDSGKGEELLKYVSSTSLPAITCGLSPRDSITLSSIHTDSAVITLQRTISCFDGSVAEPQEIPIFFETPIDSFTLMATAAVFILLGNTDQLKQAYF